MNRIKLEAQPDSPFSQGLLGEIRLTADAFVPILLWLLGLIGYRLLDGTLATQWQPFSVEVSATDAPELR